MNSEVGSTQLHATLVATLNIKKPNDKYSFLVTLFNDSQNSYKSIKYAKKYFVCVYRQTIHIKSAVQHRVVVNQSLKS